MWRFSAGPSKTMRRSSGVSSLKGTSVRTPISRTTSVMSDHMNWFHGATAPCSMVRLSSGTSTSRLTSRTVPVPEQAGHAPSPLNASCSALGPKNSAPHSGQTIGRSAATLMVGGAACPLGQRWLPRRENMRRREFNSSVCVPKVERMPGTAGRWCSASAAGTYSMLSTSAAAAEVMRRRV